MKLSNPVDYERAAVNVECARTFMTTDPDVLEHQQREAAEHVAEVRKRVADEQARHRHFVQHFLLCPKESA
jgi:hypothetical protein